MRIHIAYLVAAILLFIGASVSADPSRSFEWTEAKTGRHVTYLWILKDEAPREREVISVRDGETTWFFTTRKPSVVEVCERRFVRDIVPIRVCEDRPIDAFRTGHQRLSRLRARQGSIKASAAMADEKGAP